MFGLTEKDWAIFNVVCLAPLKKIGARVWIFGSRARGDHRQFSDLDVIYDLPKGAKGPLPEIKDALEESDLTVKVDLVLATELAESYRQGVERDRIEV